MGNDAKYTILGGICTFIIFNKKLYSYNKKKVTVNEEICFAYLK